MLGSWCPSYFFGFQIFQCPVAADRTTEAVLRTVVTKEPCLLSYPRWLPVVRKNSSNNTLKLVWDWEFPCVISEPFGSLLQGGGSAAPTDQSPSPANAAGLAMRHNTMPHAEPWFHGRISRQKVGTRRRLWECVFLQIPSLRKIFKGHVRTVPGNMHVKFEVRSFNRFKLIWVRCEQTHTQTHIEWKQYFHHSLHSRGGSNYTVSQKKPDPCYIFK